MTFLKKDDDGGTAESRRRFEEIYTEHYAAVSGYVRRRTDHPDDCADVMAETFTTAWRRLADLPAWPNASSPAAPAATCSASAPP